MNSAIAAATSTGIIASCFGSVFSGTGDDGGGGSDGGSGGGD